MIAAHAGSGRISIKSVLSHQFLWKLNLDAALGFTVDENNREAACGLPAAEALVVVY